jgi:methanogenic corrinoid protein MtbC1
MSKIENDYLRKVDYFKLTNTSTLEDKVIFFIELLDRLNEEGMRKKILTLITT